ncbi:MAG: SAM-dependent chlorinase/fluorinase [Desulfobacterales bacterium]|nr:SAM-dependent chlorinase/fluorinase [Deltaproteobacteria bacterium]NNL41269.1 SAM-dependent chlorinase/fluorinase [Desulfobacterales bacterium]
MSVITLTTDFGDDEYAGIMKGVILSLNPSAIIVDVTHHISSQDLLQAAYSIYFSYRYFPQGTVHVVVVDPTVGSDRKIIALKKAGHIFLAPDNGVLTLLINEKNNNTITRIDNTRFFLDPISQTFHGRDIFAPVSAHLAMGVPIKKLGTPVAQKNLICLSIPVPYFSKNGDLVGTIVSIDHFGNLITNIHLNDLESLNHSISVKNLCINVGNVKINGLSSNYSSVKTGDPLAIIGSRGCLEISVNSGSAANYFIIKKGDIVRISTVQ